MSILNNKTQPNALLELIQEQIVLIRSYEKITSNQKNDSIDRFFLRQAIELSLAETDMFYDDELTDCALAIAIGESLNDTFVDLSGESSNQK